MAKQLSPNNFEGTGRPRFEELADTGTGILYFPSPYIVKIFMGWDTARTAVYVKRCICSACLGMTCPIHTCKEEEDGNYD